MLNRNEFMDYLKENVKDYLPESFTEAKVDFQDVIKNNDDHQIGVTITRDGEQMVPTIYIDQFYQEYQKGADLDELIGKIADIRIEYDAPDMLHAKDITDKIMNYEAVKDLLEVRICDTKENTERLSNLANTEHGDFSATYHIHISEMSDGSASTPVTTQLLANWGISVEQLHQDAMAAVLQREAVFSNMEDLMSSMLYGTELSNLLENNTPAEPSGMALYCLTNEEKMNGASLILQDDLMKQIGDIVGGSFYVLPSSVHEVLIVPESAELGLQELTAMVYEVNRTEVAPQDRLSDEVQHYDKDTGVLENAHKRESRLEMEKAEKTVAKEPRKSIHDRLGEKKQQSNAQKAEKTAEKAVKKSHGQEL